MLHRPQGKVRYPRFRGGFTIVELVTMVAVVAIIATIASIGYERTRARSRDANRRSSVAAYHSGFELYKAQKQTYFVELPAGCTDAATPMAVHMGAGCVGKNGNSEGRMTHKGQALHTKYGYNAEASIAEALVQGGFMSAVLSDPLTSQLTYDDESTLAAQTTDFYLTICKEDGSQATSTGEAKEFAIRTALELPSKEEQVHEKQTCGGQDVPMGDFEINEQ